MKPQNYRGYQISYEFGYYWSEGKPFNSLTQAKKQIDIWAESDELEGINHELELND